MSKVLCLACLVGAAWLSAQSHALGAETTAQLKIGGPGSCSSEGFNDPGRLSDGITEASATYTLTLDDVAATLTLVVDNTSPVIAGVNNPLLTDIYFNAPMAVTGMTLMSQTATAGQQPNFGLTFDADLTMAPNPNGADGFGAFSVALSDPGGVEGSIANPNADTYVKPANQLAISPVTFVLSLSGAIAGLTADDFRNTFSSTPPGNKPSHGVGKFQAGGDAESSGFINDAPEDCFLIIGPGPGPGSFDIPVSNSHSFLTQVGPVESYHGVLIEAPGMIPLPNPANGPLGRAPTRLGGSPRVPQFTRFYAQVLMWNPDVFPDNPEQWSNALEVTIWPDGAVRVKSFGTPDGMELSAQPVTLPDGRRFLSFPFTIDGI